MPYPLRVLRMRVSAQRNLWPWNLLGTSFFFLLFVALRGMSSHMWECPVGKRKKKNWIENCTVFSTVCLLTSFLPVSLSSLTCFLFTVTCLLLDTQLEKHWFLLDGPVEKFKVKMAGWMQGPIRTQDTDFFKGFLVDQSLHPEDIFKTPARRQNPQS